MRIKRDSISQLLITQLVGLLGFEAVADRFGYPSSAPYLYFVFSLVFLDLFVLSTINYFLHGFHPILEYPFWFLPPIGAIFGIYTIYNLSEKYDDLASSLSDCVNNQEPLRQPLVSIKLQFATYLVFLIGVAFWLALPGVLSSFLATSDFTLFSIDFIVINDGGYYLVIAEVIAVFIGIHILLPYRIIQSEIDLNFADPNQSGGLRPVGRLIQQSTRLYFAGLFAYTIWVFAARFFPSQTAPPNPGQFLSLIFLATWLFGFILYLLPTMYLHYEIQRQKRNRLEAIYDNLAEIGRDADPVPNTPPDEELPQYLYLHRVLDHIERTRDYPTDAALMRDLGISAMPSLLTYIATTILTPI